jgi:hypothetical protein
MAYYNAGVVVVNLKVVGLAPGAEKTIEYQKLFFVVHRKICLRKPSSKHECYECADREPT